MKAVLVYSGGIDSTVLLYHLRDQGYEVKCLGIDYGQKHIKELTCGRHICERLDLDYQVADLSAISPLISGNALTDKKILVPHGYYTEEKMKITVVPNRNMIMLSLALGYAITNGCEAVAYAAHAGDHTIYPDCRPKFVQAMDSAAALCHFDKLSIVVPFINLRKAEIVARGLSLGVPFEMTWSCYEGGNLHCGKCGTCVERQEAFMHAGIPDPTQYQIRN